MEMHKDYLNIHYDPNKRPPTSYPDKFVKNLQKYLFQEPRTMLLDIGSGRGDFALAFKKAGFNVHCCDIFTNNKDKFEREGISFKQVDLRNKKLPYPGEVFDIVFCKSVIEHLEREYTDPIFEEAKRVLRPGGKLIIMTPDWYYMSRVFYEDVTHITPFTKKIVKYHGDVAGFSNVNVINIIQLPLLWQFPLLYPITRLASLLPDSFRKYDFVRYSKEICILGVFTK